MTKNNKNLLIKSKSSSPLKLNESVGTKKKEQYIFEGIFTACSTPDHIVINRNNRRYDETEVLKHLKYLRENILQNGNLLLGECDHPVDRFDTQIKEAAVATTNLWYDFENHNLMGRMKILDTPRGQILKTLVIDEGYPLYVSSRACGEVHDGVVSIQQIFCWDAVITPGFQEARLQRVMESCSSNTLGKFLTESLHNEEKETENSINKYGVLFEGVTACEIENEAPINEKSMKLKNSELTEEDLKAMAHPLNESEDKEDKKEDENTFTLPQADLNPSTVDEDEKPADDEKKEDKSSDDSKSDDKDDNKEDKKTLTDEEKAEKRAKILGIEAVDSESTSSDEDKDEKRAKILDVEVGDETTDSDGDEKSDKEADELADILDDEDLSSTEEDVQTTDEDGDINLNVGSNNQTASNNTDSGNGNASGNTDSGNGNSAASGNSATVDMPMSIPAAADSGIPNEIKTKEKEATAKEVAAKSLNDKEAAEDVESQTKKDMDKIAELLKRAKKVKDVKESICQTYPFAISLSDENFAKFAALKPASKNKVQKFIMEHDIYDVKAINELWATPLLEERRQMKNWLRLASEEDKRLFTEAPMDVQDAIEESAKYVMIQTQEDADKFWERTGLRQKNAVKMINESMVQRYGIQTSENVEKSSATAEVAANLGYQADYFKMLEDMY